MFNRNAIWVGLVLGLAIPVVGYAVILTLLEQLDTLNLFEGKSLLEIFRPRTLMLIALCLNVIPFNYYQKRRFTQTMRGFVLPTTVYAIAWAVYFGPDLFQTT